MKIKRTYFLTAAVAIPLLFLVMGCDVGGGPASYIFTSEGAYRIDCFMPEHTTQMVFQASGALVDEGTIEGDPLPLDAESSTWVIYREFEGQKGSMVMRVEAGPGYGGPLVAEGTFTVLGGNGAYAHLEKQGDFYAALDTSGELVEVFKSRLNGDQ